MKRFGNPPANTEMDPLYLFHQRLYLLIIMVKARMKGYPIGEFRKASVIENAAILHKTCSRIDITLANPRASVHLFKERVKLLSVMATAMIADDYPIGLHRRKAILENIDIVVEAAFPGQKFSLCHDILMAA